jgi:hypothetical protein
MMMLVSALLGLIAGIILTVVSEIIKTVLKRRVVAAKLFSDSIATLGDILENDKISFVATARRVYTDKNPGESKELLDKNLNDLKEKLKLNKEEMIATFKKIKSDKLGCEKNIYLSEIVEDKFKNDCLILSSSEISLLPPIMQTRVKELIENYFYIYVNYRFLTLRINSEDSDIDMCIDDLIETYRYIIKAYKDRDSIHSYSQKIANQSLLRGVLRELRLRGA